MFLHVQHLGHGAAQREPNHLGRGRSDELGQIRKRALDACERSWGQPTAKNLLVSRLRHALGIETEFLEELLPGAHTGELDLDVYPRNPTAQADQIVR